MKFPLPPPRDGGMRNSPLKALRLKRLSQGLSLLALGATAAGAVPAHAQTRDTLPDTWVGADALGRTMPGITETGPLKPGKTVAMFYFLWLGPHENGGPYDITKILQQDPAAMQKPDSPLWGPMHVPHHWGEPHLGYYRTDDEFVLAKHAQMLADAGVDTLVFDVTNQLTYAHEYRALLETFSRVRKNGGRTPQVAFLSPFWTPKKVVRELWRELYSKGDHEDLWFKLDGKPFILANPALIGETIGQEQHNGVSEIAPGAVEGQTFTLTQPAAAVSASFATWGSNDSGITLSLRKAGPTVASAPVLTRTFTNVQDNSWLELRPDKPLEPGEWILEASQATGKVGWWRHTKNHYDGGTATLNGAPVEGDRMFRAEIEDDEARQIRAFFTFRSPQADYFRGPERPDMWSWLEAAPQHVFKNARGEAEMMSVGVAQNAVAGKLGCLSTAGALGRTWHDGARDTRPDAVRLGLNFTEQWRNARLADPPAVFVTGWNEWIAGRYNEFNGVREPVMFVDQFSQEFSRDIEPMRGGHGDDYYYQLVSEVRRFKGVRPLPAAGPEKTITMTTTSGGGDGKTNFSQWSDVTPVFLDDAGDTTARDHIGYGSKLHYENRTGRNDILECRVARDSNTIWFYAKTRDPLTPSTGTDWMRLLIDTDANPATGWHGYDFRFASGALEQWTGTKWEPAAASADAARSSPAMQTSGSELQLAIPRAALKLPPGKAVKIDFKWMDNIPAEASPIDWIDTGDTAPNGRLNYRFQAE